MMQYKKGYQVEVLKTTLEHSWQPARIVEGRGNEYTIEYDVHHPYGNRMAVELVLVEYIRPSPPVVEFSNWSRGDLVHVFDNFAWKLATVLQVLENKLFMVRVVGSMLDLIVDAAWIRVRHCWQDGRWILVGKGPSISNERQPCIRNTISNSRDVKKKNPVRAARRKIACQKSHNLSTRLIIKRNDLRSLDQREARIKVSKISRSIIGRHSPCTVLNQTYNTGTGTGMRSRLTEEPQGSIHPPSRKNATANEMNEKHENCDVSCVGSCSINTNSSSHQYREKYDEHHCNGYVSDAESCTGTSHALGRVIYLGCTKWKEST